MWAAFAKSGHEICFRVPGSGRSHPLNCKLFNILIPELFAISPLRRLKCRENSIKKQIYSLPPRCYGRSGEVRAFRMSTSTFCGSTARALLVYLNAIRNTSPVTCKEFAPTNHLCRAILRRHERALQGLAECAAVKRVLSVQIFAPTKAF